MAESFQHVYISAPIEMKAKYKVVLLQNDTDVCKPGALIGYRSVGVSFALGVEKGMRRDKYRVVKMFCLSRGKIGKTGKYRGNGKTRKSKKQSSTCSFKSQLYQKNKWTLPNKRETIPIPF